MPSLRTLMLKSRRCTLPSYILYSGQLEALSKAHGVSSASIVLRWLLQRGIAAIPKTTSAARLVENLHGPFGWALNDEEMRRVSGLDEGLHCRGDDPVTMA